MSPLSTCFSLLWDFLTAPNINLCCTTMMFYPSVFELRVLRFQCFKVTQTTFNSGHPCHPPLPLTVSSDSFAICLLSTKFVILFAVYSLSMVMYPNTYLSAHTNQHAQTLHITQPLNQNCHQMVMKLKWQRPLPRHTRDRYFKQLLRGSEFLLTPALVSFISSVWECAHGR